MATMTRLFQVVVLARCAVWLAACEQYNNPVDPQVAAKKAASAGSTDPTTATASNTSGSSGGSQQVASGTKSLTFAHTKLSGVGYIASATVQDGSTYFLYSASSETGPFKLGVMDSTGAISSQAVTSITPMAGSAALLDWTKYRVAPSGQPRKVYLSGNLVNTQSWAVEAVASSTCMPSDEVSMACLQSDGKLRHIAEGIQSEDICNLTSGAEISTGAITYSGNASQPFQYFKWHTASCTSSDGYLVLNSSSQQLVELSSRFNIGSTIDLSNYPYTLAAAFQSGAAYQLLGCGSGKCFSSIGN